MIRLATCTLLLSSLLTAACGATVDPGDAADAAVDVPRSDTLLVTDTLATSDSGAARDAGRPPLHHRPTADLCLTTPPAVDCGAGDTTRGPNFACLGDAECTAGANGRCIGFPGPAGCACTHDACTTDGQCGLGGPCACHTSPYLYGGNQCVPGNCHVDADCGPAGYCSPTTAPTVACGSLAGYYCHTAADRCLDDTDCPSATPGYPASCIYNGTDARWECTMSSPICL